MAQILIVDDDPQLRKSFRKLLAGEGHEVEIVPTGEAGLEMLEKTRFDLVIMDVRLPGINGLEAFKIIHEREPQLPVIIMTAFGTTDTAIRATREGAFDYVLKPFDVPAILALIQRALEASPATDGGVEVCAPDDDPASMLVGRSPAMQELCKAIGRVAPTDALVLLRGESGTGKELVARALHSHSLRSGNPFVVINCVAIPETLLESELFGYEKGAFTGAGSRRSGRIELANRGTVFLDEIGDMPLSIQAKILRLLQERKVERLGGGQPVPVDVRIIAATNRDLEAAISEGAFREDLYYRLNVVTLRLPPLRDREGDVELLADHFLIGFSDSLKVPKPALSERALAMLRAYPWPGNVRELANVLQNALIFSPGGRIGAAQIAQALGGGTHGPQTPADAEEVLRDWIRRELAAEQGENIFEALQDKLGALVVAEALRLCGGNRTQAARLLGISRPTLIARIEKFQLTIQTRID